MWTTCSYSMSELSVRTCDLFWHINISNDNLVQTLILVSIVEVNIVIHVGHLQSYLGCSDEAQQGKKTICGRWTLLEIILLILLGVSTLVAVSLIIVVATNSAKQASQRKGDVDTTKICLLLKWIIDVVMIIKSKWKQNNF